METSKILQFPQDFLWGASTSAYQTEGGVVNDWSVWEKQNADRLCQEAKQKWSPGQQERFPAMSDRENYFCGQACNSFAMFEKDLACLKDLGCNAYRLGVEWARIEPEKGRYNYQAISRYREIISSLKENKIKTVLTLWHWTNPLWVAEQGGWENRETSTAFINFTRMIVAELGDLVDYWVTLNEPLMIIGHGYLDGKFPPNKKFSLSLFKVLRNFFLVHRSCYQLIHEKFPQTQVGIAMTTGAFSPANRLNPIERLMVVVANYFRNNWFLGRIKGCYDYIGVNYYHHDRLIWHPPFRKNLNEKITDRGWEIYPAGIYQVLKNYQHYQKPILILENGIADEGDLQRKDFIKDHLKYVHQAITEGVDVRGYFHWSLLDNFEWAEGYWPKFGLYQIDRKTFQRTPRDSAFFYRDTCKNNRIVLD